MDFDAEIFSNIYLNNQFTSLSPTEPVNLFKKRNSRNHSKRNFTDCDLKEIDDFFDRLYQLNMPPRDIFKRLFTPSQDRDFVPIAWQDDMIWTFLWNLKRDLKVALSPRIPLKFGPQSFNPELLIKQLEQAKNIVFLVGAGISVSASIPDFRSHNGIYKRYGSIMPLDQPEHLFTLEYVVKNPYHLYQVLTDIPESVRPTPTHQFLKFLSDNNKLLRIYTQNIDCLETKVGIPSSAQVQVHGRLDRFLCVECHRKISDPEKVKEIWDMIRERKIPYCPDCANRNGIIPNYYVAKNHEVALKMRQLDDLAPCLLVPDVVFFDKDIDENFGRLINHDCERADLFIVIGTSLKVRPVCGLVGKIPRNTPQLVFNMETPELPESFMFDLFCRGACDDVVQWIMNMMRNEDTEITIREDKSRQLDFPVWEFSREDLSPWDNIMKNRRR